MTTRYEIPLDLWIPVRDEILHLLRDVARRQSTITYSSLAAKVTRFALAPESYALHWERGRPRARRAQRSRAPTLELGLRHEP